MRPTRIPDTAFRETTDRQWDAISRHLPRPAGTGRPEADDRRTASAIFFVLMTGCVRADIPREYGSKPAAHRRFQHWRETGVWQRMPRAAIKNAHARHGTGMQKIPAGSPPVPAKKGARDRIHGIPQHRRHKDPHCVQGSLPLSTGLTPASVHDPKTFGSILDGARNLCGRNTCRRIGTVFADKGYDTKGNRRTLGKRGFADGITYGSDSRVHNAGRADRKRGRSRCAAERAYARFKAFRRIGVRYERRGTVWRLVRVWVGTADPRLFLCTSFLVENLFSAST